MPQVVRYLARLEVTIEQEVPIDPEDEEDESESGEDSQNTEGE